MSNPSAQRIGMHTTPMGTMPNSDGAQIQQIHATAQRQTEQLLYRQRLEQQNLRLNQSYVAAQQYRYFIEQQQLLQQSSARSLSAPLSRSSSTSSLDQTMSHQGPRPYQVQHVPPQYQTYRPIAHSDSTNSAMPPAQQQQPPRPTTIQVRPQRPLIRMQMFTLKM